MSLYEENFTVNNLTDDTHTHTHTQTDYNAMHKMTETARERGVGDEREKNLT